MRLRVPAIALALFAAAACSDPPSDTPCGPDLTCERATEMCVADLGIVANFSCQPVPSACEDDRSCGCAGDALCPGVPCVDAGDNHIECCPKCGTPVTGSDP